MLFLAVALGALFIWHVFSEIQHRKTESTLMDRVMSKDLGEFNYFQRTHPVEVKALAKEIEATKAAPEMETTELREPEDAAVSAFLREVEEDWMPTDLDPKAVRKLMKEQNMAGSLDNSENNHEI